MCLAKCWTVGTTPPVSRTIDGRSFHGSAFIGCRSQSRLRMRRPRRSSVVLLTRQTDVYHMPSPEAHESRLGGWMERSAAVPKWSAACAHKGARTAHVNPAAAAQEAGGDGLHPTHGLPATLSPRRRTAPCEVGGGGLSVAIMGAGTVWIASRHLDEALCVVLMADVWVLYNSRYLFTLSQSFPATCNNTMFNGRSFVTHSLMLMIVITSFGPMYM